MPLQSGTRLGVYEILVPIGAGGMGEVYRARDTKLNRDVALKILPDAFAADPDRLARFTREAQTLAALNHPNIAHIHGLEDTTGIRALVMELVEGDDLSQRISAGPLPLAEALAIARQITEALESAHDQGIVHRDLKPANIKVTVDGKVKVLDFGLAKALDPLASSVSAAALANSPTITSRAAMTAAGVILGTAAYMSPEQAKGRGVDRRADIWAFGCVLFEMLTGTRAYDGEDISETLATVLRGEPDWTALPPGTPLQIQTLLRRCTQKDPQKRLPHIGVARLEIDDAIAAPAMPATIGTMTVRSVPRWKQALPWGFAALLGLAVVMLIAVPRRKASPVRPMTRLELNLPAGVELYTLAGQTVAVSPDGSQVAFIGVLGGVRQLYVRAADRFEAVALRGTENASMCFFSSDGRSIGFITAGAELRKVSLADGLVVTLVTNVDFNGGRWGSDGRIVFLRKGALRHVSSSGGKDDELLALDAGRGEVAQEWPTVLPGAKAVVFSSATASERRIELLELATGARRVLFERATFPLYAPSGHLLFYRDGELLAAPFNLATLSVTGSPARIVENLPQGGSGVPLVDVSESGTAVYAPMTATSRLVWVSRQGAEQPFIDTLRTYANPRISPDGSRVLVQAGDLWIQDVTRSTFTRLTSSEAIAGGGFPVWAPGGGRVVFRSMTGLQWRATDGSGAREVMAGTGSNDYPGSISADGERLLFVRISPDSSGDIFAASLRGDPKITPILKTPAYEGSAKLSPDGRWIAYSSNESGQMEVYVRPFPGPDQRTQVSTQGGVQPVWNANGKELFYRIGNKMMAVTITAAPALTLSQPKLLFEQRYAFGSGITISNYDVSADGQRFVMIKDESSSSRLNVILDWFDELRRLAPGTR